MTPERWQQIEALYHAARARSPESREAFLAAACDDDALRREVESLLKEPVSDGGFLEEPAFATPAATTADIARPSPIGRSLGGYRVQALLGAGGMGEVYQARDARLGRDVAIKILPPDFTTHADRLARLEREARTLAALNHPNICSIYGLEEVDGVRFLVLELVEGETLTERIARRDRAGLSAGDAVAIARQIAEALEAAHEKGVVHRDLKPANIKITPAGVVKVLDFGLAKTTDVANGAENGAAIGKTIEGVILGTAAYMSPEQARGRPIDKRGDIWAFGCVLYEMLTGRVAFAGDTISDTIGKILEREPDWAALPAAIPAPIRRILTRCLKKDPKQRLRDIGDARVEIDAIDDVSFEAAPAAPAKPRAILLPWVAVAALAAGLAAVIMAWAPWRRLAPAAPMFLTTDLSPDASLATGTAWQFGDAMALSPEGDMIVFVARDSNGTAQLYLRRLGQMLQATPLLGTEGASAPFFSPDGQSIGFFVGSNAPGRLKKIAIKGGAPVDLASAPDTGGGAWAEDGTIVFASRRSNAGSRLMRVPQDGGTVEPVGSPVEGEVVQSWPQILPGGKAVLYTGSKYAGDYDNASLMVQPLPSGTPTPVLRDGYHGRYLSSGHLVYIHDGKLYAVAFDLGALKVTGRAVPVVDAVASNAITGGSQFSVSASGMLVYLTGPSTGGRIPVEWMDRTGKSTPLVAPENWFNIRLAPGGNRLAVEIRKGQADIFVYDLAGTAPRNLTALPNQDKSPVWTPTGGGIVYASDHENQQTLVQNLWWRRADGTGDPNRLTSSPNFQRPGSWHPTGAYLAFEETTPATATTVDVMILPLTGDDVAGWKPGAPPFAFANSKYPEAMPAFSRDGNWLAYCSNEQGQVEVYVQPFRGRELHPELRIKIGKGSWPTWSGTNKLFFGTTDGQIMVARYTVKGGAFLAEPPELWSEARYQTRGLLNRMFDLDPNEERFALARAPTSVGAPLDKVTVVWNFFEELRRLAPETRR